MRCYSTRKGSVSRMYIMKDKILAILKQAVENGDTAGANVLVLVNGKEVLYCEYGMRDLENHVPLSRDTIFRLYSQTKPITAAAVMLLAARGKVDLSAGLSDYLPEFEAMYVNENGVRKAAVHCITVRDLMNMTSGLAYPDEGTEGGRQSGKVFRVIDERLFSENPVTTAEFAEMMAQNDLCFDPGERFMYGTSADILGALVEKVSGMSYREFLIENLFQPLEMTDTDFYVPAEKSSRLAKVYDYSPNGLVEVKTNHLGLIYDRNIIPAFQSGGAGLCSTLDDYSKFAAMLINGGQYNGKCILPKAAVRYLTESSPLPSDKAKQLVDAWGWMTGYAYKNLMRICADAKNASIFSSNGEYGWDGWLGTFFSNEPAHGVTLLFGTQQIGVGKTGTLVRKIKNIVMSELT